jgi:hypothetical protein
MPPRSKVSMMIMRPPQARGREEEAGPAWDPSLPIVRDAAARYDDMHVCRHFSQRATCPPSGLRSVLGSRRPWCSVPTRASLSAGVPPVFHTFNLLINRGCLSSHGAEVTPGSNVVGEDLQGDRLGHRLPSSPAIRSGHCRAAGGSGDTFLRRCTPGAARYYREVGIAIPPAIAPAP